MNNRWNLAGQNEVLDEIPSFIDHHKTALRSSNGGKRNRSAAQQQHRRRRGDSIHGLAMGAVCESEQVILLGTFFGLLSGGCVSQGV